MNKKLFLGRGGLEGAEAKALLAKILTVALDFKTRSSFLIETDEEALREISSEKLPIGSTPIEQVVEELVSRYFPQLPNFNSPNFMGFPDAGNSVAAIAAALLSDFLNVNMINSTFCSRGATEMEIATIRWLREIVGYPTLQVPSNSSDVGGVVLYGGTMANFTACLLARERAFPDTMSQGVQFDTSTVKIVLPDRISHYTMRASLSWLGLGSKNLLYCPIDNFRYHLPSLRALIRQSSELGQKITMLTAYAGDSRTMTIDRLRELHDFVRAIDPSIWLHCDGCHGTSLCFSETLRDQLNGIELWDSITLDPHKVLNVPYPLSVLLIRDPASMKAMLTESDLIMRQKLSLGQTTPVLGSKSFIAFKLWMLLKVHGVKQIGKTIEARVAQARDFASRVEQDPRFALLNAPEINSVVFVWIPPGFAAPWSLGNLRTVSELNQRIYDVILERGRYYVHSFRTVDNRNFFNHGTSFELPVLRVMTGNPLVTDEHFSGLLEHIHTIGTSLLRQGTPEPHEDAVQGSTLNA